MNTLPLLPPSQQSLFDRFHNVAFGFDTLWNNLNDIQTQNPAFPPYNIEYQRSDTGDYSKITITAAVAGFNENDIKISMTENMLTITGNKTQESKDESKAYVHRGIANRNFERKFALGQYLEVQSAEMKDGLLTINLERIIPEHAKPKTIPINTDAKAIDSTKVKSIKKTS